MPRPEVKMNLVDRVVSYWNPSKGLQRLQDRAMLSSFDAAQKSRLNRDRSGKKPGGSGDDHIDRWSLWELRETARDLDRNNGLAMAIVDRVIENVFGPYGFELRPKTPDDDINKRIQEDFRNWMYFDFDARREFSGWEVMRNVYRSELRDGDFFMQYLYQGNGSCMGFEGERVTNPRGAKEVQIRGLKTVNGIAKQNGIKKYLWVADENPKSPNVPVDQGKAIRADNVVQFYNPRRYTQGRGLPICTPLIREIDDIDDLLLFERLAAKKAASNNMVVYTENPVGASEWMTKQFQERNGDDDIALEEWDPLGVNHLRIGEKIDSIPSNHPGTTFEPFIVLLNRYVGIPMGLPLELVLLDFSKVNFASSRQLLNQAQRRFEINQDQIAFKLYLIYRLWLDHRIDQGHYDKNKMGAFHYAHNWAFPGWPSPNPLQDAQACALAIQYAFGSRTDYNRRRGISQDRIEQELENETKQLVERSIPISDKINPMRSSSSNSQTQKQEAA